MNRLFSVITLILLFSVSFMMLGGRVSNTIAGATTSPPAESFKASPEESNPPVANFDWSPLLPLTGEPVTFDASTSSPGLNGTETMPIVSYNWDFGDENTTAGQVVTHDYSSVGNYTVRLNVTDSEGLWNSAQKQIRVGQPHGPVAQFVISTWSCRVGEIVEFNASSSIKGWNGLYSVPIVEYLWNFGDGNITSMHGVIIAHAYAAPGIFNVTLTVTGADTQHSSRFASILVIMPTSISVGTNSSCLLGSAVGIIGSLRDVYGNGLNNESVVLQVSGLNSSYPVPSGVTDPLGNYTVQWLPPSTGYFTIQADWAGNTTYSGSNSTTTLSTLPCQDQYVFSVASNSTISELAFNTTDRTLSFAATGANDTIGYSKITVAKNLVGSPANITVYVDSSLTSFSTISLADSILLTFSYTHSTHQVLVDLGKEAIPEFSPTLTLPMLMLLSVIVGLCLKKRKT